MHSPSRILVIKLKHIGDVLLATPAIHALKVAFPGSRIWALVPKGTEEMLTLNPDIEGVQVFHKGRGLHRLSADWTLLRRARQIRPDLVLEMGKGDREAIIGFFSGAKIRVGYDPEGSGFLGRRHFLTHLVRQDWSKHVVESNLDLVRALGIEPRNTSLRLFTSDEDRLSVDWLLRDYGIRKADLLVVVHPTSRWLFKCWTDDNMARVADYLSSRYQARVVITCSPEARELRKARRILSMTEEPVIDLTGRLTLKQLAALICRSHLFVGIDSAPMHIAAAVGTPVTALFGPSAEHNWRPWGEGHLVICRRPFCPSQGTSHCERTKRCECLETVTVEEVIDAVDRQLFRFHGVGLSADGWEKA